MRSFTVALWFDQHPLMQGHLQTSLIFTLSSIGKEILGMGIIHVWRNFLLHARKHRDGSSLFARKSGIQGYSSSVVALSIWTACSRITECFEGIRTGDGQLTSQCLWRYQCTQQQLKSARGISEMARDMMGMALISTTQRKYEIWCRALINRPYQ